MKIRKRNRAGFTLIEVLTVIAIIGILVGLLIPAINAVRQRVANARIVFEVQSVAQAVAQYKTKFGDYPPDGSNRATFERHFRKAFPNIAASEFVTLYSVANNASGVAAGLAVTDTVMDGAEALVFCLGGFSDDPAHPFTGPGGPLVAVPGSSPVVWQYNVNRNEPLHEFKQEQLTLFSDLSVNRTISTDEETLSGLTTADNDLLPVYLPGSGQQAPLVYFDSRTYSFPYASAVFFNVYHAPNLGGYARPYKSENFNTSVSATSTDWSIRDAYVRYANDNSFQIISAGIDDDYGGVPQQQGAPPMFYKFPSGDAVDILNPTGSGFSRYTEQQGIPSSQLDNVTNFADGVLEDAIDS